ncbi:MAG: AsmA-like C-terminal region-containing protein [Rhodospirillaceae bacterium]|nr:AsmA-like C-terminal region-containing protein [Rhodospirillaceae bacterium]
MISSGVARSALIFAAAVAALLGAVAVFAPRMVDVRGLAPTIGAELSQALGADVRIRGDILLVLVPTPRLILRDIATTSEVPGGFALRAPEARADLAWGDLVLGRYVVTELRLREPAITLSSGQIVAPGLALSRLRLDRARILVARGENTTKLEALNADITRGATGAITWTASGLADGLAMDLEGRAGPALATGRRNVQGSVAFPEADLVLEFNGQHDAPVAFNGRATLTGARVAEALSAGVGLDIDPARWPWSADGFTLAGDLKVQADAIDVANAELKLGDQAGTLSLALADLGTSTPRFDLRLDAGPFDVLRWLPARPNADTAAARGAGSTIAAVLTGSSSNWTGDVTINAPLARIGAQSARDIRIIVARDGESWNVRAASATLPGQTRLSFAGFLRADDATGTTAEGSWQADVQDGRGLLAWLGIKPEGLPVERLATLRANGTVQSTASLIVFNDLALAVDGSTATGRVALGLDGRAPLTVDLDIDRLALDAYGPLLGKLLSPPAAAPAQPSAAGYSLAPIAPWLAELARLRAALRLQVEQFTWRDVLAGKLGADIVFADGAVDIRSLALEDPQTAALWVGGRIESLDAVPAFKTLQVEAKVIDVARFGRILRADWPQPVRNLAPWTATGALNGTWVESALTLDGTMGGLAFKSRGTIGVVERTMKVDTLLDLSHPDIGALRRKMWPGQSFAADVSGALSMTGKLSAADRKVSLTEIKFALGSQRLSGEMSAVPSEKRFDANIADIDFDLRPWAATLPPPPVLPMGWSGEVTLAGPRWRSFGVDAREFSAKLVATPDEIKLTEWRGRWFDGRAQVAMTWSRAADETEPDTKRRAFKGQVAVQGADAGLLFGDAKPSPPNRRAVSDIALGLESSGLTAEEMMANMSGSGSLGIKVPPGVVPTGALSALGALVRSEAPDGRSAAALEASAAFAIENAAVIVTDGKLLTNAYTGSLQGSVDLARRVLDLSGTLKLKDRALIVGEAARLVLPPTTAFTVKGALDAPTVSLNAPK